MPNAKSQCPLQFLPVTPTCRERHGWLRRLLAGSLAVSLLLLLLAAAGCAARTPATTGSAKPQAGQFHIVTSFLPIYIFTANLVAGIDGISLENMAAPETGCLHDYRLLPADLIKLEQANLFIINGAGMENFMTDLAERIDQLAIVEASTGIDLLKLPDGTFNPHVWLSVRLAIRQVQNISRGLQQADPAHQAQYLANERQYVSQLEALQTRYKTSLAGLTRREIITFHEAFPYFAAEYGLTVAAVIEREPGSEPTAAELAATIELIRKNKIPALFAEPQYPLKIAETIARETGATVNILDPVVTGALAADAYIKAMDQNLQVLLQALS